MRCNKLLVWLLIGPPFGKGTQFNRLNHLNSYWECCSDLLVIVSETSLGQKDVGVFLSLYSARSCSGHPVPSTWSREPPMGPLYVLSGTPHGEQRVSWTRAAVPGQPGALVPPQTDGVTEDGGLVSHPTHQGASDTLGPEPRRVFPPLMGVCCPRAGSKRGSSGPAVPLCLGIPICGRE